MHLNHSRRDNMCVGLCFGEADFDLSQNWGTDSLVGPTNASPRSEGAKNKQTAVK